jgi:hypothetical protein
MALSTGFQETAKVDPAGIMDVIIGAVVAVWRLLAALSAPPCPTAVTMNAYCEESERGKLFAGDQTPGIF